MYLQTMGYGLQVQIIGVLEADRVFKFLANCNAVTPGPLCHDPSPGITAVRGGMPLIPTVIIPGGGPIIAIHTTCKGVWL